MIPILYEKNTTNFTGNGIGRLSDCISCVVEEKESGVFECKLKYPISGIHYSDIQENRIVYCIHDDAKKPQPFKIYGRSAPINGVVDFYAHHISYDLGNVVLEPFTSTTCTETFVQLKNKEIETSPFSFWTDKASTGNFEIKVPTVTRSILGGVEGSILDVFGGGDYEWDGYTVKLWNDRGQDNNVNIRYGVNLINLMHETDYSSAFNAVVPFWYHEGSGTDDPTALVMLEDKIVRAEGTEEQELRLTALDLSTQFETEPTEEQLRAYTVNYLANNKPWRIDESITVNFVALWQTEDYKNVAPLQRVNLYDYVHVVYEELGVNKKMQVVETVYDVLNERYNKIELGVSKQSFAEVINAITDATIKKEAVSKSYVDASIARTAETIKGNRGGYKYEVTDADGHIMETLYMDSPNIETAVNILRIGQSGIAFSNHGYDPESFVTAWTIDGEFNANFIAAGEINAGLIRGGTLTLGGSNNDNGVLVVYDASGNEIGRWNKDGLVQIRNNVYSYIGNAILPVEHLVEGYISPTTADGLAVSYTNDLSNDVFSIHPQSNVVYLTALSSNQIVDTKLVGYTGDSRDASATETLYCKKVYYKDHVQERFWHLQASNTTVSASGTFDITYYPGRYYGIERAKGDTGNSYGLLLDNQNKIATISSGNSYLKATSGGFVLVQNNGSLNLNNGKIVVADGKTLTFNSSYFYIPLETNMYLRFGSSSGSYPGLECRVGTGSGYAPILQFKEDFFNLRINNTQFIQLKNSETYFEINAGNSLQLRTQTTGTSNYWYINSTGRSGYIAVATVSSKRYKHNITDKINKNLDAHKLYNLKMKQFVYNNDCEKWQYADMKGQTLPGFIAEDVEEIYPSAVIHDGEGRVESWDERRIIPGMLALIQEQKQQLDDQEKRIVKLEDQIALLQEMILHDRMEKKEGV